MSTKKCNKCYIDKSTDEFYAQPVNNDSKFNTCKGCMKAKRLARWFEVFKYKGAACTHCGISDYGRPAIYEYHHIDPKLKTGSVSTLMSSASDATLYAEVDKCILVCANCHNVEHSRMRDLFDEA
jgi:hypothetical protein